MKMKKAMSVLVILAMVIMLFAGCTPAQPAADQPAAEEPAAQEPAYSYEGELMFKGDNLAFSIAYNDIYSMETVTREVKNVSSSGEESVNKVVGVVLADILAKEGLNQADFSSIRFSAADGYAIDVPAEILAEKEIILAYEFDGQGLDEKKMPLRVAIDDVRSMYYVSNLATIEFFASDVTEAPLAASDRKIIFIETASTDLPQEVYTYYENEDQAILVKDLLAAHVDADFSKVDFIASDGFDKTESADVANQAYLKVTGEDAPLFTGIDLPKGMNVKDLAFMTVADTTFVSANQAKVLLGETAIDDDMGVSLASVLETAGLEGESFTLAANDGYAVEVSKDAIQDGVVYVNNDGTNTVKFNGDDPKNTKVKNLLSITASAGEAAEAAEGDDLALAEWAIEFDGLSDGAFTVTSEKAARKLTLVSVHTARTKNDTVKENDWEGYKLIDILDFLHVDQYSQLTITACDGYEAVLMADQVDDETILAVVQDGEAMTDADNLVQLVQNTEFSTTWVKGVAKITVQ